MKRQFFHACKPMVLAILTSFLVLSASAASAAMRCKSPPEGGSNTCLTIENQGFGIYKVVVGIDVQMSQQQAQSIIDANGGQPFVAILLAHDHDDPARDTTGLGEFDANSSRSVWVTPDGLSGSFEVLVAQQVLDEDKDGRDELVARVLLNDPRYPSPRKFHSGIITGYF